jgi:predicted PurR-regulated permease PerM
MNNASRDSVLRRSEGSSRGAVTLAVGLGIVVFVLWLLGSVLLMGFAAVLIAVALRGSAERVSHFTKVSPRLCLGFIVLALILVFAGIGLASGSRIAEQGNELWDQLSQVAASAQDWMRQYSWGRAVVAGTSLEQTTEQGQRLASGLGLALVTLLGVGASFVITLIAGVYFAAAPGLYVKGLIRLLPIHRRERGSQFLMLAGNTLRMWLLGQGVSMLVVFVASYAGLALIGVPMALLLALIAGVTNFVPYVGPIVGAVPAVLVGLGVDLKTALWVGALFAAIQFLEGNLLQPLIQRRMTHLPPALTLFSQTILGTLFGAIGVVLATPVLSVILVGVRMLYVEDVLNDRADSENTTHVNGHQPPM